MEDLHDKKVTCWLHKGNKGIILSHNQSLCITCKYIHDTYRFIDTVYPQCYLFIKNVFIIL